MEALLQRMGNVWYLRDQPLPMGPETSLTEDWSLVLQRPRKSMTVAEVHYRDTLAYSCIITNAENVWLLPKGVAELAQHNAAHRKLARQVVEALAARPAGAVFAKVTCLQRGQRIDGTTFRTRPGANNNFSDGTFRRLSKGGSLRARVSVQCVGCSYLVRVNRHEDLRIFGVDVTVQPDYHAESLERCLRHLA